MGAVTSNVRQRNTFVSAAPVSSAFLSKEDLHEFELNALALASICDRDRGVWTVHSKEKPIMCEVGVSPETILGAVSHEAVYRCKEISLDIANGFWISMWDGHALQAKVAHVSRKNVKSASISSILIKMYRDLEEKRRTGLRLALDIDITFNSSTNVQFYNQPLRRHYFPRFYSNITDLMWEVIQSSRTWRSSNNDDAFCDDCVQRRQETRAFYDHYVRKLGFAHLRETLRGLFHIRLCRDHDMITIDQIVASDLNSESVLNWVKDSATKLPSEWRGKTFDYYDTNSHYGSQNREPRHSSLLDAWENQREHQYNRLMAMEVNPPPKTTSVVWFIEWINFDPWAQEIADMT
tara:strand:+ start:1532 stop:2581 length:1050 start_codon:yes stop_codon:yes gene_type:complete